MIQFGTGGWRAEIGRDFYYDNICKVAAGIARMMREDGCTDKPFVIGYDRRFLSQDAAKWVAEVLAAEGITVWFMPRSVPTPLVMYLVQKHDLHFGAEVTASHNPPRYNGIKLFVREGRDAPLEVTERLEKLIAEISDAGKEIPSVPFEEATADGRIVMMKAPFNDFIDHILSVLDLPAIREAAPRILFDSMHGSSTYPLTVILNTARCTVDQIHANKDAYFGGLMPAPSEETLDELRTRVIYDGYDLGIAVDGDGDRLGVIDADGNYISANDILVLLYWYLHEVKGWKGPVVRNLSTTHKLDALAASFGEQCYEVPVGFKYISSKIDEVDAVLGGESSGGLTVRGHIHGKDSVYAAALFIEMMCKTGMTPGALLKKIGAEFGDYYMLKDNFAFPAAMRESLMHTLMEEKKIPDFGKEPSRVSYMDGCKVYFDDDSSVTCRFSGTEPLLRIFAEGRTEEEAQSYIDAWKSLLGI
ncbi:MAG: phosphoglucomutase/phosphomannomutase family protein [Lachnospiraceae bacterium]|nr:phosphoglucomutase/phosphomannomutase family protein [Lachnospiraceae bacterium]MBQ6903640.1 phosphoglucomutase/phosphomannomutase family protein [Lachnospiraceae bacterium]